MMEIIAIMFYIGGLLASSKTKDAGFLSVIAWPAVVAAWIVAKVDHDDPK
jgi:hypothetical protein